MIYSSGTVRIGGAGIAGMSAAITLKKEGVDVEIFEKRNSVGGRFKGDWQGIENWSSPTDVMQEISDLGIDIASSDYHPLPSLSLLIDSRKMISIQSAKALCYLVKRGIAKDTLDQNLKRQCDWLQIPIRYGEKIKPEEVDIVATGPNSRKLFAADLGIQFRTDHPDMAVAIVDHNAAPKGYAYLLIVDGYGCLCTVLFTKFHLLRAKLEYTKKLIDKWFNIKMVDMTEVGGVGSFATHDHHRFSSVVIGEAAGLQDYLFGFGIRSAIRSGVLAARCYVERKSYQEEAKALFLPAQKASVVNRFLFESFGGKYGGYHLMSKWVNRKQNPSRFMQKAYKYTPIHKLLFPIANAFKHQ